MLDIILNWISERGKETSTWQGIILLASSGGFVISPEMGVKVVAFGIALSGLIDVIRKEHKVSVK